MLLGVLQITIDRKTEEEIERKIISQQYMDDNLYREACIRFLTGMSVAEAYQAIMQNGKAD